MGYSSVVRALLWVSDRLEEHDWPSHPETTDRPAVGVGDSWQGEPSGNETVDVVYHLDDEASIEWATICASSDETFMIDIYMRSMVHGVERRQAAERVDELIEAVFLAFTNAEGNFTPVGWSADGVHASWYQPIGRISSAVPNFWPTDQGWVGEAVVTVACRTRI
jgi:hypothetical protein